MNISVLYIAAHSISLHTGGADDGVGHPSAAHGRLAHVLVVQRAARIQLHDGDVRLARLRNVSNNRVALHAATAVPDEPQVNSSGSITQRTGRLMGLT